MAWVGWIGWAFIRRWVAGEQQQNNNNNDSNNNNSNNNDSRTNKNGWISWTDRMGGPGGYSISSAKGKIRQKKKRK